MAKIACRNHSQNAVSGYLAVTGILLFYWQAKGPDTLSMLDLISV